MQPDLKLVSTQDSQADSSRNAGGEGRKSIIFLLTAKIYVTYLDEHSTLRQALEKMRYHGYAAIPVISKNGAYLGTVSEGDFLWHILDRGDGSMKSLEETPITDIMRRDWNPPVTINTTMEELLRHIINQNFVPVVDDRDKFVGIITRKDLIRHYCGLDNEKTASL